MNEGEHNNSNWGEGGIWMVKLGWVCGVRNIAGFLGYIIPFTASRTYLCSSILMDVALLALNDGHFINVYAT